MRMPLLYVLHLAFLSQFGKFVQWTAKQQQNNNNRKNEATIYLMIILNDKRHFLCVWLSHVFSMLIFIFLLLNFVVFLFYISFNAFCSAHLCPVWLRSACNRTTKRGKKYSHIVHTMESLINSQIDKICVNQRRRAEQKWMWNSMANANQQNHQNESKRERKFILICSTSESTEVDAAMRVHDRKKRKKKKKKMKERKSDRLIDEYAACQLQNSSNMFKSCVHLFSLLVVNFICRIVEWAISKFHNSFYFVEISMTINWEITSYFWLNSIGTESFERIQQIILKSFCSILSPEIYN